MRMATTLQSPGPEAARFQQNQRPARNRLLCNWDALRMQLLLQWKRLTPREIDETGPDRHGLALLIQRRYGISSELIENYLLNFERTLPLS